MAGPRAFSIILGLAAATIANGLYRRGNFNSGTHLRRCTLSQHTQEELDHLRGRKAREALSCASFQRRSLHSQGVDYVSFVQSTGGEDEESRLAVWVNGYPRSGSSTILSLVAAAGDAPKMDSRALGHTFSLFEPCHEGDSYTQWLAEKGCGTLLEGLTRCDFTGVQSLWGWPDSHTTSNHSQFSRETAQELCKQSHITAFKTVDQGHNITGWSWLMRLQPKLKVIDIVRDPRGIYASWKMTEPFASMIGTNGFYSITDVCDTFKANSDLDSPNIHHVVFEELMKDPMGTMKKIYEFLHMPFGVAQEQWINQTFNAGECPEPKPWEVNFTDCHQDSGASVQKWRSVLSEEEKEAFASSEACRYVVQLYGFPEN